LYNLKGQLSSLLGGDSAAVDVETSAFMLQKSFTIRIAHCHKNKYERLLMSLVSFF